jgi:endonuclease III
MSRRRFPWRPTDARRRRLDEILALLEHAHGPRRVARNGRRKCLDELIASMLAQNTNLANAHSGYKQLRRGFSSWMAVMNAPVDAVQRTIAICGLARLRARRMQALLRDIKNRHGKLDLQFLADQPPQSAFEYLTSYYGIGPKTAAYTLLFSFNMPLFPVDKGIHRMAGRLKIVRPKASEAETGQTIEHTLSSPSTQCFPLHVLMFDHAKKFCRPRNPKCRQCNLVMLCPSGKLRLRHRRSKEIDTVTQSPRRPRPIILSRHASAGLVKHGDGETE